MIKNGSIVIIDGKLFSMTLTELSVDTKPNTVTVPLTAASKKTKGKKASAVMPGPYHLFHNKNGQWTEFHRMYGNMAGVRIAIGFNKEEGEYKVVNDAGQEELYRAVRHGRKFKAVPVEHF